jgi:hypothetical protein
MSINEVHLKLYQTDKLNGFLQYISDTYTDVVKRINISISTMSREILDIYHMTRKKKNSALYNLLPQSYRQILYQLHSDYITQKNKNTSTISTNTVTDTNFAQYFSDESGSSDDSNSDHVHDSGDDGKVSISVDNVYTKLKELDTSLLVNLFKDRDELMNTLNGTDIGLNPIKQCTNTKIQSKLLSIRSPV